MKRSKSLLYIYPILLTLGLGLILLSSKLILRRSTEIDQSKAVCDLATFSIQNPTGYSSTSGCSEDAASIYTDDQRFTYFWLSEHLKNIPVVKTGNIREKDDKSLSWNISINKPSLTYIFYRIIPARLSLPGLAMDTQSRT